MESDTATQDIGYLTITEMSRCCGVTPRTLRFYQEKGMLQPTRVGSQRFYSPKDRVRLELILTGKRLGFSLRAIESFLASHRSMNKSDEPALVDALDPDTIALQLTALEQQKATLDTAISELRNALKSAT